MSSYSPTDLINTPALPASLHRAVLVSEPAIVKHIVELVRRTVAEKWVCRIAIDGHPGVDWTRLVEPLAHAMQTEGHGLAQADMRSCLKAAGTIEKMVSSCLPDDPTFGRVYDGTLADFFAPVKLKALQRKLRRTDPGNCVLCYGSGAAQPTLRKDYDFIFYVDLAREEILKRLRMGLVTPLGLEMPPDLASADALPAYFSTRRLYYIDYAVLDAHRRRLLPRVDYYIDGNVLEEPKMLAQEDFAALLDVLTKGPITPKPYYDPGPWGGQWLKKVRKLPRKMKNCAWSYDLIAPETSFQVACGASVVEMPFPVLNDLRPSEVSGVKGTRRKFKGQFPVRINYDDSLRGGDMALQTHPGDAYINEHFNEPFRQDESYYIVDSGKNSRVYLGLQEDADVGEFRKAVEAAERDHIPFDHNVYVNSMPSETGDLFLIPAGTLHGSGKDNVVLEISATTYRYTLHFYDYLRPGLDGELRVINTEHAFNALKTHRRSDWVAKNLKQKPRLLRKGKDWAEYLLGKRSDLFFQIHRLEFVRRMTDDTEGEFHLLIVVEGEGVRIVPTGRSKFATDLPFSCLAILPAETGRYRLQALGDTPCKVVKVLMK